MAVLMPWLVLLLLIRGSQSSHPETIPRGQEAQINIGDGSQDYLVLFEEDSTEQFWCVAARAEETLHNEAKIRFTLSDGQGWQDFSLTKESATGWVQHTFCHDTRTGGASLRILASSWRKDSDLHITEAVTLKVDYCHAVPTFPTWRMEDSHQTDTKDMVASGQTSPGVPFYLQFPYSHYPKIGAGIHHDLLVKISSKASGDGLYVAMIHKDPFCGHSYLPVGATNHLLSSKHISRETLSQTMHKNASFVYLANVTGPVRRDSFVITVYPEWQLTEESSQWPRTPPVPGRNRAGGQEDTADISVRVSLNNPSGFWLGLLLPLGLLLGLAATAATLDLLGFVVKAGLWGSVEADRLELVRRLEEEARADLEEQPRGEDLDWVSGVSVVEENVWRLSPRLTQAQMCAGLNRDLENDDKSALTFKRSQMYLMLIVIITIYYVLFPLQVVVWLTTNLSSTGDQDSCFYNFSCLRPWGNFLPFNAVFSNIGYVVAGLLFLLHVYVRAAKLKAAAPPELLNTRRYHPNHYGIPHQSGIYQALGVCLVVEGLMSSVYHACPQKITLQFDTFYMYLISVLMLVKLYQNRHLGHNMGAFLFGALMGVVVLLDAISLYDHLYEATLGFWVIFCLLYLVTMSAVAIKAYTMGAVKFDVWVLWNTAHLFYLEWRHAFSEGKDQLEVRRSQARLVFILVTGLLHLAHMVFLVVMMSIDPTGQQTLKGLDLNSASVNILAMVQANLALYSLFYITMKLLSGETLTWCARTFLVATNLLVVVAMIFYFKMEKNPDLSAAKSRELNHECLLLDFYSWHDVWHFLSAAGLYCTLMFILNVDEDIKHRRRDRILVF